WKSGRTRMICPARFWSQLLKQDDLRNAKQQIHWLPARPFALNMNISKAIIAILVFLFLLTAGIRWRRWLAAAWMFSLLVLPLIRFHIGAPIYVMDVLSALFLWQMIRRGDRFLPFKLLPWPWIFIGVAFLSTLASGLMLFGFHLEQPWIWGPYSLTCLPLLFAPAVRLETDGY